MHADCATAPYAFAMPSLPLAAILGQAEEGDGAEVRRVVMLVAQRRVASVVE